MPPSPLLRCSPGRERRTESAHKRGRSFESGLTVKAKDDDLALFNDMQSKERDNFLLHGSDDFEDSISKLRYLNDFKLGIKIPVRGESSDLLQADGQKNDYDWLLTPPDTPLFPSLDDDECQPVKLLPRGRPRSQPISISRSLTSERTNRTSRSSASPQRLSPSPRSSSSFTQLRGRPSSAPRSSPPPVVRPTTPSRRPSTPPNKPSTPAPRSSTPTVRRMSTGSSGVAVSSGRRGTSPVKASRGSSSSPKLQGWQASLEGFSADAPPNLRTSLSDRPASHARRLSPSSGNGRDTSSKSGRQSMSPTASRSASSSHSHERDHLSSYSKGSMASSGDDDGDSLQSVTVDISCSLSARKNGAMPNNRSMAFSRKPSRTVSASSAPKRSFDSAIRQMDHHKTPQNMFRPLLSSVPTTSFYVGKASNIHRPVFSRNSSLTTSSNASSEQGASNAPDIEGSDHEQNDLAGGSERAHDTDNQEEMFLFDKVDEINEDDCHEIDTGKTQISDKKVHAVRTYEAGPQNFEDPMANFPNEANIAGALDLSTSGDHAMLVSNKVMTTCSECRKSFYMMEVNGGKILCEECIKKEYFIAGGYGTTRPVLQSEEGKSEMDIERDELRRAVPINNNVCELSGKCGTGVMLDDYERNKKQGRDLLLDNCPQLVIDQKEPHPSDQQLDRLQEANATQNSGENSFQQYKHAGPSDLKVVSPEVTGISVLLQRSSSNKFPLVQGRSFSATNILCSEPSYARDNINAMKRSIGRDSMSASSSVDLGAYKQTGACVQRHLSSNTYEVDKMTGGVDARSQNSGMHFQASINPEEAAFRTKGEPVENCGNFMEAVEYEAFRETMLFTEEPGKSMESANSCAPLSSSIKQTVDIDISVDSDGCRAVNISECELLNHPDRTRLSDISIMDRLNNGDFNSFLNAVEDISENRYTSKKDIEVLNKIQRNSCAGEDHELNDASSSIDKYNDTKASPSSAISELENVQNRFQEIQNGSVPSDNQSDMEYSHELLVCTTSENGILDSAMESAIFSHAYGIQEEPTVTVEGPRGLMLRSLTLEEATESILFCSSIIHDLAYKAANIGMEKELMLLEGSRPTVTLLGKTVSRRKDQIKLPDKSSPKSHKFKRKRLEANTKATEHGNPVKVEEQPSNEDIPNKLDSLKPPKLESKCNCTIM